MKILVNTQTQLLQAGGRDIRCAIGKNGCVPAAKGREGDGKTPLGCYPIRFGLYRPDRISLPATGLVFHALEPEDGWCDAPDDPAYNRFVRLPHAASAEKLWRESPVYDVIVILGHNDSPAVPGLGSAIFLHIARDNYQPTEGCVAIAREDMLALLPGLTAHSRMDIV